MKYRHPCEIWRDADEAAAMRAACKLAELRALAALRVPGWTPELREMVRTNLRYLYCQDGYYD